MQRTWDPTFRYIVLAGLLFLLGALLWYIRSLLQPLLAAGMIAYILSPAASFLTARLHLSRRVAATIVYFLALAALLVALGTLVPILFEEVQSIRVDLVSAIHDFDVILSTPLQIGALPLDLRLLAPSSWGLSNPFNESPIVPKPSQALRILEVTSRSLLWTLVVLVMVYYLMTEWDKLRTWIIGLAPKEEQSDLNRLYVDISEVWAEYLRGQLRLIVILAVIYSLGWEIIGVPGALVLGILAGVLNLVPEVGPAVVAILGTLVAYLEGSRVFGWMPHLWFAALTLGVYILINAFKSVWLQPRILGRSVLLHEGLVFLAIVGALVLNGILGVLVVVPLLASAIIVGKYLRRKVLGLPPFDDAPGSAPALSTQPKDADELLKDDLESSPTNSKRDQTTP